MSIARNYITWQPVLTDHQAYTYEALASQSGVPAIAYVSRLEDSTRRAQGWTDTQVTSVERRLIPAHGWIRYCYQQMRLYRDDIHFFGSVFEQPRLMLCLLFAMWLGVEFYLISEPYSPITQGYFGDGRRWVGRFKAWARPVLYRTYVFIVGRRLAGIFAISRLAVEQYRAAGMPKDKLFPFGYFVPRCVAQRPSASTGGSLRLVFVGSLIERKGVDILAEAVRRANVQGGAVCLDIFGPGESTTLQIDLPQIRVMGPLPFGKAQEIIADYDILVLPSRYDGWGVVVNEALCAGVPVICSDMVGAGTVVKCFGAGAIFKSGDVRALCLLLLALSADGAQLHAMRAAAILAGDALQPSVAAAYMLEVLHTPRERRVGISSSWYSGCL